MKTLHVGGGRPGAPGGMQACPSGMASAHLAGPGLGCPIGLPRTGLRFRGLGQRHWTPSVPATARSVSCCPSSSAAIASGQHAGDTGTRRGQASRGGDFRTYFIKPFVLQKKIHEQVLETPVWAGGGGCQGPGSGRRRGVSGARVGQEERGVRGPGRAGGGHLG